MSEEAITNIRTVRAFAMESQECKLYDEKLQEVADLQIRLGLGIGLFQVGDIYIILFMALISYLLCR